MEETIRKEIEIPEEAIEAEGLQEEGSPEEEPKTLSFEELPASVQLKLLSHNINRIRVVTDPLRKNRLRKKVHLRKKSPKFALDTYELKKKKKEEREKERERKQAGRVNHARRYRRQRRERDAS